MITPHRFGPLDWCVLFAYAAIVLGIGLRQSSQQRTPRDFFLGHRRARPFLAGISLFSALFSIISYVGMPGEYVQFGPVLVFQAPLLILPFLYVIVGWFLIPGIMRLPITSAYEMLEARLGRVVRQAGSLTYVVTRLVWMSLILFVSSGILADVTGCSLMGSRLIIVGMGLVTTAYTLFGGIRTVMVTEVIQFFMLLLGAIITIASISFRMGGISSWWPPHRQAHWLPQPFFTLDPHVRASVFGACLAWLIVAVCSAGSDQAAIQRFLTTRDARAARRAYLLSLVAMAVVTLLLGWVGEALVSFFRLNPGGIPDRFSMAENGDAFFPLYISHYLPTGISGILVASLLAAAMSCLSSGITATTTVIIKDLVEAWIRKPADEGEVGMRITRLLVLCTGTVVILGSLAMGVVHGNIFEIMGKTADLLAAPVFGLFFLAIFVRFATPFGAIVGAAYSIAAAVVVGYWDRLTGGQPITFLWIAPIALAVSIVAGCGFSLLPTRGRPSATVAAYAAALLAPLVGILTWIAL